MQGSAVHSVKCIQPLLCCNHFVCLQTDVLLADVVEQGLLDQGKQAQQLLAQVCKFVRKLADISPDTTGTAANTLLCKV